MEMSEYLFIYGTLSPEIAPKEIAAAVRKLRFVGNGFVRGRLYDLGKYPGIKLEAASRTKVRGRVYRLPENRKAIESIDAFEEYYPNKPDASLYKRRLAQVELESGEKVRSWIYEYNGSASPKTLIKSGVYSKALA